MSSTSTTSTVDPERARESNTAMILAVTGTFHALALVFVVLRTYTRAVIVKTMGVDDYMMIGAALCALGGGMVIFIIQGFYGLGRHRDTINKADQVFFSKVGFFQSIISAIAALALLKISIALSLLRLSKNRWYSRTLWALIVFVVLYTIMAWLSFFLYCTPLEGYWDKSLKPTCYNISLFVNFALVNTDEVADPDLFDRRFESRLPVSRPDCGSDWKTTIANGRSRAVIMGIIKAVYQIAQPGNKDGTFRQSIQFWGFLQLNLGIIAACAPAIKPLVGRALKISSSRRYNSDNLYENRYPTGRTGRTVHITATAKRQGYREQGSQGAPDYELEEGPFSNSAEFYRASIKGGGTVNHPAAVAVYGNKNSFGDRSGSEEMILDADGKLGEGRGIMRTTEVHVQR